jgi:hypothetical protein
MDNECQRDLQEYYLCILSPLVFNMYNEYIVGKVGLEDNIGIKIGGKTINNLRYADDTTILAEKKT